MTTLPPPPRSAVVPRLTPRAGLFYSWRGSPMTVTLTERLMHALSEGPRTKMELAGEGFGGMSITDANQWWARHGSHWRVRGHQTYTKNASGFMVRGYEYELLMEV